MIGEDNKLDHKDADYCGHQINLFQFNSYHNRDSQYNISENYGTQRKKKGFSLGFAYAQGKSLTNEYEIDHTENSTQNQAFAHRFLTGQKKTKSDSNGDPNCPATIFFLCLFNGLHSLDFRGRCPGL